MSDIPKGTKKRAREIYGHTCVICGRKGGLHHHHTWINGENPYDNERPEVLPPLCDTCHQKIENRLGENLMIRALRWIVKKKIEGMEKSFEEYIDEQKREMINEMRVPIGDEKRVIKKWFKEVSED